MVMCENKPDEVYMQSKKTQEKPKQTKKQEMMKHLFECDGLVSEALKKSRATYKEHKDWLAEDEDYRTRLEEIKESIKDYYIRCALNGAANLNAQIITNVLKTYCKDRGYGADGEAPSTIEVVEIGFTDED